MDNPVTIAPEPQLDNQPEYLQDDTAPILSPKLDVASTRSQKAYLGLGKATNQTQEDIKGQIQSGQEEQFRYSAASNLNYQKTEALNQKLIDARNSKGGPLSYPEAMKIVDPYAPENDNADPHDVIERAYSEKVLGMVSTAAQYMKGTVLDDAIPAIPVQTKEAQDSTVSLTTKLEYARTLKQNVDNEISNQSWAGWGADQAKNLFQPYVEYKLRGNDPNVGSVSGGILLGNNLKAQADELMMRPIDQYKKGVTDIVNTLKKDNPSLAAQFLNYVIGNSTSDRMLDNFFTILSPLDYATGFKATKSLVRGVELNNRVNTAFKQVVKEVAKEDPTIPVKAVVEEASGDIKSAAVTRGADHITQAMSGKLDPVQDIKESFTSNFRLDGDLIDSKPGNLSAGELTELKNSFYKAGSGLYDTIVNALKVMRTATPLAAEDALKAWQEAQRLEFKGEGLLDIGSPIHMKETNTYHIPFTHGTPEERLFSDPETAYNNARMRGYADPRIESATGEVERVPGQLTGTKTDLRNKARLEKGIPQTETILKDMQAQANRKFIGPRQPEALAELKEQIAIQQEVLEREKGQLAEINKKVVYSDPVIEQNGLGYKYTVIKPYNETDDVVRSYLVNDKRDRSTSSMTGFDSWKNGFLGWIRGADDTLAFNESLNRKVATYTQSALRQWAKDEAKEIEAIANQSKWYQPWTYGKKLTNREQFNQFNEVLKYAKTAEDPATGEKGYFFKTPGDLQDHYQRYYQRLPSFQEVKAYFAHVKLVEGNRVLSEIAEFRNRARIGAEQHQIFTLATDGTRKGSGFFDGIDNKVFPGGGGQILIMGGKDGDERLFHLGANEISPQNIKKYKEAVETGKAKVIRIYDPDTHPLQDFVQSGGERIRYVMVTDAESKPLGFNHINRRGGGHFEYAATHYIKQANIVDEIAGSALADKRRVFKRIYTGDRTLLAGSGIRSQDENIAKMMNQMNGLMREQKLDEAKALGKKLGVDWGTIENWYSDSRFVNGKKQKPLVDWNEPFYVVPRNKRIYDVDSKGLVDRVGGENTFQDASKAGSDAKQFQVEYSQARDSIDLQRLRDIGTQGNPIYKMENAPFVDPIPTMNRALNRAIRSTFMDDYKISAIEHWLQEAMPHLKDKESDIRAAPFYHFSNVSPGSFTPGTSPDVISNLMSNRFKIRQFTGMPNKIETSIHGLTQILADHFYNKFGPEETRNVLQKAVTIVPLRALARWDDPVSGLRSLAFNAKLGLFAVPQFLVQAQTFSNIWALGGRNAAHGTMATMLHTWSRVNRSEGFMKAYDDMYTKMNLFGNRARPGEFMEANRELANTGFEHVGGEYQLADDQMQHKFFKNDFSNFLDAGQVFFREGEKATRIGAWYTAFREFRDANPVKVLTDADRATILQRADLLTANMSRASASALNSSVFSLPMQFLTYQVRMAELFFGKRLGETTAERTINRARLLGTYAAMYGAPGALGLTGFGGLTDSIREEALNRGYVPGDNKFYDGIMNGLISWQLAMATGKGDYKKGNQYDVQGRWGTQGMSMLQESTRSDKTVWSMVGGASVDTFTSLLSHGTDLFWTFARQLMNTEDEEGNTFRVTPAHFSAIISELSGPDLAQRGIYALHTGRWLSKNQSYIEDVTAGDVLIREITGFKSQDQSDLMHFHNIKDAEEQAQKSAEKLIINDYQRGLDATRDKDYDTAKTYFTNARARMIATGIPLDRRAEIFAKASRGYEAQTLSSEWTWATKNVPYTPDSSTAMTRAGAMQKRQDLMNYRNQ